MNLNDLEMAYSITDMEMVNTGKHPLWDSRKQTGKIFLKDCFNDYSIQSCFLLQNPLKYCNK